MTHGRHRCLDHSRSANLTRRFLGRTAANLRPLIFAEPFDVGFGLLRCLVDLANLAPDPETRTLEKPKARNLLAISALLANCSTELRATVARYRFPWWTINSPAKPLLMLMAAAPWRRYRMVR